MFIVLKNILVGLSSTVHSSRMEVRSSALPGKINNYVGREYNSLVGIGLYVKATRKAQDRNYWQQLIASDLSMGGT